MCSHSHNVTLPVALNRETGFASSNARESRAVIDLILVSLISLFACAEDYARALQKDRGVPRAKRRCSLQPRQTSGEDVPSVSSTSSVQAVEIPLSTDRHMSATGGKLPKCTEKCE